MNHVWRNIWKIQKKKFLKEHPEIIPHILNLLRTNQQLWTIFLKFWKKANFTVNNLLKIILKMLKIIKLEISHIVKTLSDYIYQSTHRQKYQQNKIVWSLETTTKKQLKCQRFKINLILTRATKLEECFNIHWPFKSNESQ